MIRVWGGTDRGLPAISHVSTKNHAKPRRVADCSYLGVGLSHALNFILSSASLSIIEISEMAGLVGYASSDEEDEEIEQISPVKVCFLFIYESGAILRLGGG
jgi:hypothetical protein